MSTAITLASSIDDIQRVARLLAASGYFDARGHNEQVVAQLATKILAGREMGYGEFTAVQGIHVIQGKPVMSANLVAAAVKSSPRYDYRVRRMDDDAVEIEFFERVGGKLESLGVSTFTILDARRAGTQNLQKFPRNMLFARAISNGVRWFCPDVFFGNTVYVPEEMAGNYIDATPAPAPQEVQPAPTPAPAAQPAYPAEWDSPDDAYEWAVSGGYADNVYAARNAFRQAVDAHGGRLTRANADDVYASFYAERIARREEKAAQAAQAAQAVPNVDGEADGDEEAGEADGDIFA